MTGKNIYPKCVHLPNRFFNFQVKFRFAIEHNMLWFYTILTAIKKITQYNFQNLLIKVITTKWKVTNIITEKTKTNFNKTYNKQHNKLFKNWHNINTKHILNKIVSQDFRDILFR